MFINLKIFLDLFLLFLTIRYLVIDATLFYLKYGQIFSSKNKLVNTIEQWYIVYSQTTKFDIYSIIRYECI